MHTYSFHLKYMVSVHIGEFIVHIAYYHPNSCFQIVFSVTISSFTKLLKFSVFLSWAQICKLIKCQHCIMSVNQIGKNSF